MLARALRLGGAPLRRAGAFSLADRVQEKRERKQFEEFVAFLTAKEAFLLKDYKEFLADTLAKMSRGVLSKFMANQDESREELQRSLAALSALREEELLDDGLLEPLFKRQNVAAVAALELKSVAATLSKYKSLKNMHFWLRRLKAAGRPLPADSAELQNRFQVEHTLPYAERRDQARAIAQLREKHEDALRKKRIEEKRMEKHARVLLAQRLVRAPSSLR